MILTVIDMVANGCLQKNLVEPSYELATTYSRYWQTVADINLDNNLAATFLELENDGFWEIIDQHIAAGQLIDSMGKLQKSCLGARIDADIYPLLTREHSRKKLREMLITTYFADNTHAALLDIALINHAGAIYSEELLSGAPVPRIKTGRGEDINARISSLGFNSAILQLYDHRCAICGIKLITPEGRSAVTATHIIPRHISKDDHPRNGIAFCRICSWSFENGLLGISDKLEVIIPTAIRLNGNLPGHLLIFKGRVISKPKQKSFWPLPENLAWHRKEVLRD